MTAQTVSSSFLECSIKQFQSCKSLGEGAFAQIDDRGIHWTPDAESNSIAVIVKHLHGNMLSRWTDFLTSDGDKPWRQRDMEFIDDNATKDGMIALWEEGWRCTFEALNSLTPSDLLRTVTIRTEPHTVLEALSRQIGHYAYHVGQIVYVAKSLRAEKWNSLTIPKGKTDEFNARFEEHQRKIAAEKSKV